MKFLETPESRFDGLTEFPFESHFAEVDPLGLRMHFVDEGPRDGQVVLLLHGEPTWSYLYRKMIPQYVTAGYRVIAPDLIGFGRSSKPTRISDHSYAAHVAWVGALLDALGLQRINLFGQDWGSLIGLRLVGEDPDRFSRVVIGNGYLPTGQKQRLSAATLAGTAAFLTWRTYALHVPHFVCSKVVSGGSALPLSAEARRAYDAPFPSREFLAGPRAMPALVPLSPSDPAHVANMAAWEGLGRYERPFLTLFSTGDPIMRGLDKRLQRKVPGASGQPHWRVRGGHFLQEDSGHEIAARMIAFMRES